MTLASLRPAGSLYLCQDLWVKITSAIFGWTSYEAPAGDSAICCIIYCPGLHVQNHAYSERRSAWQLGKNIITVSGADHHDVNEANAALVTFRYVLRLEWPQSLSNLLLLIFYLRHCYSFLKYIVWSIISLSSSIQQTCVRNW